MALLVAIVVALVVVVVAMVFLPLVLLERRMVVWLGILLARWRRKHPVDKVLVRWRRFRIHFFVNTCAGGFAGHVAGGRVVHFA
eukprot:6877804-Pyramimonas_sp.AAC.1